MSTKTTFKRIALVTVAALGFGLLSVAPSTATSQSDTLTLSASASTCVIGTACTITVTQSMLGLAGDTMSVTAQLTTNGNASSVVMPVLTDRLVVRAGATTAATGYAFVSADGLQGLTYDTVASISSAYRTMSSSYTASFTATHSGTNVVTFRANNRDSATSNSAVAAQAAAVTWTITVSGGTTADATSGSVIKAGTSVSTGSTDSAANDLRFAAGITHIASIRVTPRAESVATTGSNTTVAVVSGPGSISSSGTSTGARTLTQDAVGAGAHTINVFGDGTTGTTTITITMGTLTFTETVYFYGAAASVTTTTANSVIHSGSGVSSNILLATVKDANGNVRPGTTVYAVSGTTTVFASTSAVTGSNGVATIAVTGLGVAGTSSVTVQNVASGSTATYSAAAVSIRVGSRTANSVTMTLDKATYTPGESMLLTLTIKDATGELVAPGTHEVLSTTLKSSRALSVADTMPGASIVTVGSTGAVGSSLTVNHAGYGVVTYALSAPNTSGAFTLSATAGADNASAGSTLSISATVGKSADDLAVDAAIAAATAAGVAATAAATAAGAAAVAAAEAATDAATEAIDAANAATDSANAAAEAADAATAAAQQAGEDAVAASEAAQAAAVDAAAEATEAANAATDAANAAAESADAATAAAQDASDAVAALSTQVATLISGLKAQLTALTNLVIKIQKKVKA